MSDTQPVPDPATDPAPPCPRSRARRLDTIVPVALREPEQPEARSVAVLGVTTLGKDRLGGICKRGDRYIRRLLVVGAHAVIRYARTKGAVAAPWINNLLDRRSTLVVAVALANKTARIAWAVLTRGECYHPKASASV